MWRGIMILARVLSAVFRPYYFPLIGFVALFTFTYLRLLPPAYKVTVLLLVYALTILLPRLCTFVYRRLRGWTALQLRNRERRSVPYVFFILSYALCLHLMLRLHLPHYMCGILLASLMIQLVSIVVNVWWKISLHAAGAGGLAGALVAYSVLFAFNPVGWLCGVILLCGAVGSARMLLRQHSLGQVVAGTLVGVVCGAGGILLA